MTNDINTPISDFFDILAESRFRNLAKKILDSESAPFNVGKIRMSVRIFENKPIRGRARQMHEFFFNKTTLGNIDRKTLIDLEPVFTSDNPDTSSGVTLKRKNRTHHTFLAYKKKKSVSDPGPDRLHTPASAEDTENFGSFNSAYIQNVPASDLADIPPKDSMDFFYNQYIIFSNNEAEQHNSCFYPAGSIYSYGGMSDTFNDVVVGLLGGVSERQTADLEWFFKGLDPDVGMQGFAPVDQDYSYSFLPFFRFAKMGISYISVNCAYPGSFFKALFQDAFISNFIKKHFTFPAKAYVEERPVLETQDSLQGLTPGKHISLRKLTPIFPGEDFSISFRKSSSDESVPAVKSQGDSSVAYRLHSGLEYFDVYANEGTNYVDYPEIPPNFGVAKFEEEEDDDGNMTFKLHNKGASFSSEPYVMVEIDGSVNNWYFLIISYGKTVRLFEVHDQSEIVNIHAAAGLFDEGGQIKQRRVVPSNSKGHSSLLYEFDFTGDRLLKEDRFRVSFQHVRGALQVSFDVVDKTYIVSRERLGDKFLTAVENDEFDNKTIDLKDFDKIEWQFAPIKLRGFTWVHMGHYSASFNFSPIEYVGSAQIEPNIPIPVLGFFGARGQGSSRGTSSRSVGENVTSMLLRSLGAPYDVDEEQPESTPSDDYDSPIDGMEPLYYKQQAQEFWEIVNGKPFTYKSFNLPESQKQLIPGMFEPKDRRSINYFNGGVSLGASRIVCLKTPNRSAEGRNEQYAFQYNPTVSLHAGSVLLKDPYSGDETWKIYACTRPICTGFTSLVAESKTPIYFHETKEVGQHVISFSDNWSRNDRSFIDHNGNIKFYLSRGPSSSSLGGISVSVPPGGSALPSGLSDGSPTSNLNMTGASVPIGAPGLIESGQTPDETAFLTSLQDKTFYIRVYAWREGSPFSGTIDGNPPNNETKNHLIFTGICEQSSFDIYDSHVEMSCQLNDYNKILEDLLWFNCPYYDSMRDVNVIYDIVVQAGLFSGEHDGSFDPASLIKKYHELPTSAEFNIIEHNGDCYLYNDYILPGHYDPLQNQMFKFDQGTSFFDSIKTLASVSGKTSYFDRFGVLHFDVPEDEEELYSIDKASSERTFDRAPIRASFWWTSHPGRTNIVEGAGGSAARCSGNTNFAIWNTIIGEYNFKRLQGGTVNEVRIISTTPEMKLLIGSNVNVKSLYDPTSQGFRGYKKTFLQQSGYFGSRAAVEKTIARYGTMFVPPSYASFQVLGRAGLRPMHTITLDGIGMSAPMRLVLVNVSNTINASKNEWTTSLEGRYLYPGQMITFKTNSIPLP